MNNTRTKDLTGKEFNRLNVLSFFGRNKDGRALWNCQCSCGSVIVANAKTLLNGDTKSCGCLKLEKLIDRSTKHNGCGTAFYMTWKNMKARCNRKNSKSYKDYGGRGIIYDSRWGTFEAFKSDMCWPYVYAQKKYRNVKSPLSIERKDVNGNYCKENCIFIPMVLQNGNTRRNKWFKAISPNGKEYKSKNQSDFAREHGLNQTKITICLSGERKKHKNWVFHWFNNA